MAGLFVLRGAGQIPAAVMVGVNPTTLTGLIVELRQEDGVTVIVATHDEDVAREASRRIRMRDGRIAAGAPEAAAGD